jgi:hypothetical protein
MDDFPAIFLVRRRPAGCPGAEMLAVGSVTEGRVPDPDEEALRDLSRLRSGTATDFVHTRQHVNAILLCHGTATPKRPDGQRTWAVAAPPTL